MKKKIPVYWRRLIVRAIEDSFVLLGLIVALWLVGASVSLIFSYLNIL